MRQADIPRTENRARINRLFNGWPPFSDQENRAVNCNFLEGTVLSQHARAQFMSGFMKSNNYFTLTTDSGAVHERANRSTIVTGDMNRILKDSLLYYEKFRAVFAGDVLHGIGPAVWRNGDDWCSRPVGVEDVLMPSNITLTDIAANEVPFFAIYRSMKAPELIKLTSGPKRDPAWNMPLVKRCVKWLEKETSQLMSNNWPETWSPEKRDERVKSDGGFFAGDNVPTLDVFDFYFWNDDGRTQGWYRKMLLDAWATPAGTGTNLAMTRKSGDLYKDARAAEFLYNPGNRKYASKMSELITFQFADLSAVFPAKYHSVRSLGFLIHDVCDIQNRMRCSFNEAVFEALLNYFRVKSADDIQRVLKVMLENRGFIDPSVQFVPPGERWQPNMNLIELGLQENKSLIAQHSAGFTASPSDNDNGKEKTRAQYMSELQTTTALVAAALGQAYMYQKVEYNEIVRRFFKRNSPDPDVRQFQMRVMKKGVPERMLNPEAWNCQPEQIVGAGNKTLELQIAQQLMAWRDKYDPGPQRQILSFATLALTDNAPLTQQLVPEQQEISNSIHDAQLRFGSLMAGGKVDPKSGVNHTEVIEQLLQSMGTTLQRIQQTGGKATIDQIIGLQSVGNHIAQEIGIVAKDEQEKQRVKQYGDVLGKLMNGVKALAQRYAEQQKQQQAAGAQMDPKDAAKLKFEQAKGQLKIQQTSQSHAQRTAQRDVQFQLEQKHRAQEHALDLAIQAGNGRMNSMQE